MILNQELEIAPPRQSLVNRWPKGLPSWPSARTVAIFFVFLALIVALQLAGGAYQSEFGAYPDESAHYVTSLMVRDYITHLHFVSPIKFAASYYHHYPKVAIGHWPPLFYLVQALWMMIFSASRASIRLEVAFTTALLAFSVYAEGRRWFSQRSAFLAGLLTVCLPLVQTYADEEMAESLLTLMCFWSAIFLIRYMDSERWQDALWFGVFFSLAVLTKGSGWLLVLLPLIAFPLTHKLRLFLKPSFWISAVIVGLTCVPWQIMTLQMAEQGWTGGTDLTFEYTFSALQQFLSILIEILGPILFVLAAIGIVVRLAIPAFKGAVPSDPAVMFAFIASVWIFHSLVPAGIEDRKMIIAVPPLVLFLFSAGIWIADHLPFGWAFAKWRRAAVAIAATAFFCVQTFAIPRQLHCGYDQAAQYITSHADLRKAITLVSSQSQGEGLLISEIAMRVPHPDSTILRGTKELAEVDFNASTYYTSFSTPAQIIDYLDSHHVGLVVIDTFPPLVQFPHCKLLQRTLRESNRSHLIATFPSGAAASSGRIELYRFQ